MSYIKTELTKKKTELKRITSLSSLFEMIEDVRVEPVCGLFALDSQQVVKCVQQMHWNTYFLLSTGRDENCPLTSPIIHKTGS